MTPKHDPQVVLRAYVANEGRKLVFKYPDGVMTFREEFQTRDGSHGSVRYVTEQELAALKEKYKDHM